MAKVLPSDVAERIARAFPWVKGESRESVPHPANQQQALNWIAGVLALVEQIPDSLLRFDSDEYGSFLWAQAGLRQLAESFRNGSSNPPWPTVENNNAMTILWRLLK